MIRKRQSAFTIIELIIVIVVIGILATLVLVAYNGVAQNAIDKTIQSDADEVDNLETQYTTSNDYSNGTITTTAPEAWYSGSGVDSHLNFTPSSGNIIDVVTNTTDYCIRIYNPSSNTYNTLATAYTKESTPGTCALLPASLLAQGGGGGHTFTTLTWSQLAGSGSRGWTSIATSADGTKIAATVGSGYIYTSTDSGATWTQRATSQAWTSISSSSDGTKLLASANGYLYTSSDSGVTWTQRGSSQYWQSTGMSSNGTIEYAGTSQVYVSTDSGVTWTATSSPWASSSYIGIGVSSDGTKVAASNNGSGTVYVSSNTGSTWTSGTGISGTSWGGVASSSDGTRLIAYPQGAAFYLSSNSGSSWTHSSSGSGYCNGVASSADGSKLFAGNSGTYIYTSIDSGSTWQHSTLPVTGCWRNFATSSDGSIVYAANGYIYQGLYN